MNKKYLFLIGGLNTVLNYRAIKNFFGFTLDYKFLAKMIVLSAISYITGYSFVSYLVMDPWIELISGGILIMLIYLIGFILLRIFSKQDLNYLKKLAMGFGPLKPIITILADFMMRFV